MVRTKRKKAKNKWTGGVGRKQRRKAGETINSRKNIQSGGQE